MMEVSNEREAVSYKNYKPLRDNVVLKGVRKVSHLILPDEVRNDHASDQIFYNFLEVVGYGRLTRDVQLGNRVHLPESKAYTPIFLWGEEDEADPTKKIDYFSISEAFIKGLWIGPDEIEESEDE